MDGWTARRWAFLGDRVGVPRRGIATAKDAGFSGLVALYFEYPVHGGCTPGLTKETGLDI